MNTLDRRSFLAASGWILSAFLLLFSQSCTNSSNADLISAAERGDVQQVKSAIANGADANVVRKDGIAILAVVLTNINPTTRAEIVRLLVKAGGSVNFKDKNGWTALMWVQDVDAARELINAGAEVNATNNDGETPLMFAKDAQIVDVLIQAGAVLNAKDHGGKTALDHATEKASINGLMEEVVEALQKATQNK